MSNEHGVRKASVVDERLDLGLNTKVSELDATQLVCAHDGSECTAKII
jgi:hypothetical protein